MIDLYKLKLNQIMKDKEQLDAFLSNKSTVVRAGPGSGKTTILTVKIMNLLKQRINEPRGLACITFSNEAVNEFTGRLNKMGFQKRRNVKLSTVHSFCISEIIAPFSKLYNKNITLPLNMISDKEKNSILQDILRDYSINPREVRQTDMDNERNMLIGHLSKVSIKSNVQARKVAIEYEKQLKSLNKVDFIEIVKIATEIIDEEDYVRKCLEAKFPWILIDEYQDLGKPLHEIVLTLLTKTKINFFIVGDPNQSIYGFQGGHPGYLKELHEKDNIKSIELKTNYRSNQEIIDLSTITLNIDDREYIAGTRQNERADIRFITCESEMSDQYEYIVNTIIPECIDNDIALEEICILTKSQKELKELSKVMDINSIPYYYAKQEFLRSQIVLWLKDCASWVVGSSSVSFTELNEFWLKFGSYVIEEHKNYQTRKLYTTLKESRQYRDDLGDWINYISKCLSLVEHVIQNKTYDEEIPMLKEFYSQTVPNDLNEYSIKQFSQLGEPNNQVTLSTRHSSKGLEFEVVILLGLEEGNFPFFMNVRDETKLNEERRVFYVSLTRAKRVCYLLRSKRITYRSGTKIKGPSMFWNELSEAVEVMKGKNK